jgi:hypothetical protein
VSGDGGLGSPSSPRQADAAGAAALVGLGIPSAAALRKATPAGRRQLLRQAWDAPLRRAKLRRLRHTLATYGDCLDELSAQGRRTLVLRAGLGSGRPASRRAVARRLGVPLKRELRVESGALRKLTSAGRAGLCGAATTFGSAGSVGGQAVAGGSAASQSGQWSGPADDARRGVLGVSEHSSGDSGGGGPKLDFVDRTNGAPNALLLLALAILGPLGVALLATRSSRTAKPPRT